MNKMMNDQEALYFAGYMMALADMEAAIYIKKSQLYGYPSTLAAGDENEEKIRQAQSEAFEAAREEAYRLKVGFIENWKGNQ